MKNCSSQKISSLYTDTGTISNFLEIIRILGMHLSGPRKQQSITRWVTGILCLSVCDCEVPGQSLPEKCK